MTNQSCRKHEILPKFNKPNVSKYSSVTGYLLVELIRFLELVLSITEYLQTSQVFKHLITKGINAFEVVFSNP